MKFSTSGTRHFLPAFNWGVLVAFFLSFFSFLPAPAHSAQTLNVLLSENTGAYKLFVQQLEESLARAAPNIVLRRITHHDQDIAGPVIAVGTTAAQRMVRDTSSQSVMYVLVPRTTCEQLLASGPPNRFCLYLDQPVARQLALLQLALPQVRALIILRSSESYATSKIIERAATEQGYRVLFKEIGQERDIVPAIDGIRNSDDVILWAIPDRAIFTPRTAAHILLTSYNQHLPVFAYSAAYVRAGAMLSVYSSPIHIAQQVAEIITQTYPRLNIKGSPLLPPKYYAVAVNEQVARSLGITMDAEQVLLEKLTRTLGGTR